MEQSQTAEITKLNDPGSHRSRLGCFTCRKRKKRCDEVKPICRACRRLRLECEYPQSGLERKNKKRKERKASKQNPSSSLKFVNFNNADSIGFGSPVFSPGTAALLSSPPAEMDSLKLLANEAADIISTSMIPFSTSSGAGALGSGSGGIISFHPSSHRNTPSSSGSPASNGSPIKYEHDEDGNDRDKEEESSQDIYSNNSSRHQQHDHDFAVNWASVNETADSPLSSLRLQASRESRQIMQLDTNDPDDLSFLDNQQEIADLPVIELPKDSSLQDLYGPFPSMDFNSNSNIFRDLLESYPRKQPESLAIWKTPASYLSLNLDDNGRELFDYYHSRLAKLISLSPDEYNSFLTVFVPMAHQDISVLYALLAWSAIHLNRTKYEYEGIHYMNLAIESIRNSLDKHNYTTLAGILIVCAAQICSGDVEHWDKHLTAAAAVIKKNGGIESFCNDSTLSWLASNFAYHDLLASSTCARNTHFSSAEYDRLLRPGFGIHSLIGCTKPLFQILAEISSLAVDSQRIYQEADACDEKDTGKKDEILESMKEITSTADILETKIQECRPAAVDIITLSVEDLEYQLTFFETMQLTAKLHLRQSVRRFNSSCLEVQILVRDLINTLDIVLGTKVEGSALFPLFIAAINSFTSSERKAMKDRFDTYYARNKARNITRALQLVEEVWKLDHCGTKHVDWYSIFQSRGWDLCFA